MSDLSVDELNEELEKYRKLGTPEDIEAALTQSIDHLDEMRRELTLQSQLKLDMRKVMSENTQLRAKCFPDQEGKKMVTWDEIRIAMNTYTQIEVEEKFDLTGMKNHLGF